MLNCLRAPMASSLPCSSSSPSFLKRHSIRTLCLMNSNKFLIPPFNPKDPLLSNISSVAANSPLLLNNQKDSDMLLMAAPAQIEMADRRKKKRKPRRRLGDRATDIFCGRAIYIGTPLFAAVTQLVVAQLIYLQWSKPKEPIYMIINSTGTTRDEGDTVGMESEGFAIYDTMMLVKNEIHTFAIGNAVGQACLLLAAGTKGKRYMMPHATAMITQPKVPSFGLMQTSDIVVHMEEAKKNRDTFVELLSRHTGNSIETINNVMRSEDIFYMDPTKAIEFGVADKIYSAGDEKMLSNVLRRRRKKAKKAKKAKTDANVQSKSSGAV